MFIPLVVKSVFGETKNIRDPDMLLETHVSLEIIQFIIPRLYIS